MRVLQLGKFYPPHKGGMETSLENLCRGLQRSLDVRVLVAGDGRATTEEVRDGVPLVRLGVLATLASMPICPGLRKAIAAAGADIIHLNWPNPWALACWLAASVRAPLVVTYHSDVVRQRLLARLVEPLLQRALGRATAILVGSPNYRDSSLSLRPHLARCRVVPFGIDPAPFAEVRAAEVRALHERFGGPFLLCVGRLVYYKGLAVMLEAMRELAAPLVVVGTGPLSRDLMDRAAALGVAERVHFVGEVPEIAPWFQAASLFVLPSIARSEAFGLVQLEAMAAGIAVVNTALDSGVPFVSPHGVTGLTVPPEDPGALAAAIRHLLADPALRARFGAAGRERVRQQFTVETMVERTVAVYADITGGLPVRRLEEDG